MDTLISTLRDALELLDDYAETDVYRTNEYERRLLATRSSLVIIMDSLEDVVSTFDPITPPAV